MMVCFNGISGLRLKMSNGEKMLQIRQSQSQQVNIYHEDQRPGVHEDLTWKLGLKTSLQKNPEESGKKEVGNLTVLADWIGHMTDPIGQTLAVQELASGLRNVTFYLL